MVALVWGAPRNIITFGFELWDERTERGGGASAG